MRVVQIPLLRDNYAYLILCEKSGNAAVIDPSEAEPVLRQVAKEGVKLTAILNTHHHWDHTGGNSVLTQKLPLKVYAHRLDHRRVPGFTHPLDERDELMVGELKARIFFIPGHTKGHIAYLFENRLFCGDTLFVAGCGRLFEGTAEEMYSSLSKLKQLSEKTLIYCGHEYTENNLQFALTLEPKNRRLSEKLAKVRSLRARGLPTVPSTLAEEKETNPFLRWDSKEIRETLRKKFPGLSLDPISVFAKIRELKDQF